MNNIAKQINTIINCILYVNDFLIYYRSKRIHAIEHLQVSNTENGSKFSEEKTKCMHFCWLWKMHLDPTLKLDNKYKYLVKILSFILCVKYIKSKCYKAMKLLTVLVHTDWGAEKDTLLKLYWTLVRSKLDCGAAKPLYSKDLNTIHHQGLRLAIGIFKTSPVESLYSEVTEPPQEIRWKKFALQYCLKLSSCPSNPTCKCTFHPPHTALFNQHENSI